jgi:hypothetical protein
MGHLKRKLILTRKDQNYQSEEYSDETPQRQTVWRQGGECHQSSMESLVPDVSKKKNKAKRDKVVLMHVWLSSI